MHQLLDDPQHKLQAARAKARSLRGIAERYERIADADQATRDRFHAGSTREDWLKLAATTRERADQIERDAEYVYWLDATEDGQEEQDRSLAAHDWAVQHATRHRLREQHGQRHRVQPRTRTRSREHRPAGRRRTAASSSTSSSDPGEPAGEPPAATPRAAGRSQSYIRKVGLRDLLTRLLRALRDRSSKAGS